MQENEILNWFGTDPFEAGYTLITEVTAVGKLG
jgi:hypothetical protein